jgi:hypothetical protein
MPQNIAASSRERPRRGTGLTCVRGALTFIRPYFSPLGTPSPMPAPPEVSPLRGSQTLRERVKEGSKLGGATPELASLTDGTGGLIAHVGSDPAHQDSTVSGQAGRSYNTAEPADNAARCRACRAWRRLSPIQAVAAAARGIILRLGIATGLAASA